MKNIVPICLLFILLAGVACQEKGYPKPDGLLSEKKMVNVLHDIHLAEAMSTQSRFALNDSNKIKSGDIYQAVLDKYNLNDSIVALSLIYYSSRPKVYEKIYTKVMERLNVEIEDMNKKRDLKVEKPETRE